MLTIVHAFYLGSYTLLLQFNDGEQKRLDFLPLFKQYAKGDYDIYIERGKFKRFKLESGNIIWGKNEDVIFPVSFLYNHPKARKEKEEILYVL